MEFVRKAIKSWVMKVFLGLLVASFAVFGIGDVFTASLGSSVLTVGDQKVDAERFFALFDRERRATSERFGQPLDIQLARQLGIDQQVLGRMAAEATLDQQMQEMSISAPDEAVADTIVADPSFASQDGFDETQYQYLVAQSGYSVEGYEAQVRRALARNQLTAALAGGGAAPAGAAETLFRWQNETRRFDYIVLNIAEHADEPGEADDAALQAYIEANEARYSAPAERQAVWLSLDIDELAKGFEADEAEVQALYESRASLYNLPETRALYQTIFDDEAAADAAIARVQAGEVDFDGLLAERGETRDDVSLGEATEGDLAEATAAAAFGTSVPGIVGPVDTGFGFALIDVAAITPAEVTPLEDARAELALDINREAAIDAAMEIAGEVDDLRAGGSTLEEIARELNLTLQSGAVTQGGSGDGLAGDPAFQAEVFASDEDEERDIVETDDGGYFVVRVDAIREAALRPLGEVREQALAGWRTEQRLASVAAKAEAILARVDEGELMAAIADEMNAPYDSEGPKTRTEGWENIPFTAIEELFADPVGGAASGAAPSGGAYVVAQVMEVFAPELDQTQVDGLQAQLDQVAGSDALQLFLSAKQEEAGVTINGQLIESLFSQAHGG